MCQALNRLLISSQSPWQGHLSLASATSSLALVRISRRGLFQLPALCLVHGGHLMFLLPTAFVPWGAVRLNVTVLTNRYTQVSSYIHICTCIHISHSSYGLFLLRPSNVLLLSLPTSVLCTEIPVSPVRQVTISVGLSCELFVVRPIMWPN